MSFWNNLGFKRGDSKSRADVKRARSLLELNSFNEMIKKDETISDVTKEELLNFKPSDEYGNKSALLRDAREGIKPMFKARQGTQAMFETMLDQPGRRQTIASASNRNNVLLR